ncbi:MAG: hypothetical protein AB1331_03730 [Bacillota bacterium]
MKKGMLVSLIVGLLALALAVPAFAWGGDPAAEPSGLALGRQGKGMGPARFGFGMIRVLGDMLGLTPADLASQITEGMTFAQLAEANGISSEQLVQETVKETMTRVEAKVQERINQPIPPRPKPGQGNQNGQRKSPHSPMVGLPGRQVVVTVAELMKLEPSAVLAELRTGKSLVQIGAERGVTEAAMLEACLVPLRDRIDLAVAEGKITQERSAELLQNCTTQITKALNFVPKTGN